MRAKMRARSTASNAALGTNRTGGESTQIGSGARMQGANPPLQSKGEWPQSRGTLRVTVHTHIPITRSKMISGERHLDASDAKTSDERGRGSPENTMRGERSKGEPLAADDRRYYGRRLGHDFSRVRIHTGSKAAQIAEDLGAEAATSGQDVFFSRGRFSPKTDSGRNLLAHELKHVVQQRTIGSLAGVVQMRRLKPRRRRKVYPALNRIEVKFTRVTGRSEKYPLGKLTSTYYSKWKKRGYKGVRLTVSGGGHKKGVTDIVRGRFYTNKGGAGFKSKHGRMPWAIEFLKNQAIHVGSLRSASRACVHVPSTSKMKTLNKHSKWRKTKIYIRYSKGVLKLLCKYRIAYWRKTKGNKRVPSPCGQFVKKKKP